MYSYSTHPQKAPAGVYIAATFVIFVLTLSAADSIGFVPNYIDGSTPLTTGGPASSVTATITPASDDHKEVALSDLPQLGEGTTTPSGASPSVAVLPDRITIGAIDLDLPVQNTASRDETVLDTALMKGPVRYVDSAKLGENGNMLIFAHSSHLPIVHNKMFQAFNRISELKAGDVITVHGGGVDYLYSVTTVRQVDTGNAVIDLSPSQGTKLTLSTCDTVTSKTSRFVVEADFIGKSN